MREAAQAGEDKQKLDALAAKFQPRQLRDHAADTVGPPIRAISGTARCSTRSKASWTAGDRVGAAERVARRDRLDELADRSTRVRSRSWPTA